VPGSIETWLKGLGLSKYSALFAENEIGLDVLPELTEDDLKDLGIPLGDRKRLLQAVSARLDWPDEHAAGEAPPAPSPEAQRRHLTVMFCDLVGSTGLAERFDAETLREILRSYQDACAGSVVGFEGHVAKYIGDGLLAYFGYPRAHEDDAARAVHAGRGILAAIAALNKRLKTDYAVELQVRIGIHTGPVVAGEMGGGETREEHAIVGETPNIAARLEALAAPDTVLISGATLRLIEGLFEFDPLGPQRLKGVSAPVEVFSVTGEGEAPSRFEATAARSLVPLIGREEELRLLERRWELAKDGESQVVLLSAEAGVGKSRLLSALRSEIEDEPYSRILYFGSPYHRNSAFHVAVDQFRRALRFARDDSDARRLDKLEAVLAELGMSIDDHAPVLGSFLSVPAGGRYASVERSPAELKMKALASSVEMFRAMAAWLPVLIAVEDAHWIDPSTLELLSLAIEQLSDAPILFLITFRPEFDPPWEGRGNAVSLKLGRLSRKETAGLVTSVAGGEALPRTVMEQIVARADGVPLFVEELTKAVIETGVVEATPEGFKTCGPSPHQAIPETLQDSLTARLDRLAPVKEIAQLAATIGRNFSRELLAAAGSFDETELDRALSQLVDAELIYPRGLPPAVGYEFKHALVRDSAYQSLLKSRRQQFHQQIAEALVRDFPQISDSEPEVVAHHLTEAARGNEAVPYWLTAAQRANERSANQEAIEHCRLGLALISDLPANADRDRPELAFDLILAPALMAMGGFSLPEVGETYERAAELADRVGDFEQSYAVNWGHWIKLQQTGKTDAAKVKAEELLELARQHDDSGLLLQAHHSCWTSGFASEELHPVLVHTERGMELYNLSRHRSHAFLYGGHDPGCCCRTIRAITLSVVGRADQARAAMDDAIALAEELEHAFSHAMVVSFAGSVAMFERNPELVHTRADASEEICARHGFAHFAAMAPVLRGWAIAARGEFDKGIAEMTAALETLQKTGMRLSFPLALLAEAYSWAGQQSAGLKTVNEAIGVIEKTSEHRWEPEIHRLRGELLLIGKSNTNNPAEAEICFQKALDIARGQGALLFELRAATSQARLLDTRKNRDAAHQTLAPVYARFTEGFETPDLKDAKALLDQIS